MKVVDFDHLIMLREAMAERAGVGGGWESDFPSNIMGPGLSPGNVPVLFYRRWIINFNSFTTW